MQVGVSQRHVSFVESGKAKPSRTLLLSWLQALDAPLAVRNAAMLQAGFAPAYSAVPLHDPALAQANAALIQLLAVHDPMPAFVIDAHWNVLHVNSGGRWLAATLMPHFANLPAGTPLNMLDMLAHPEGFAKHISNLTEVGPVLLAHLRMEASALPALNPKVEAFSALLHARLGKQLNIQTQLNVPLLTTRFATEHGELAFFSMFTTFGTPQDITLASLRVEHMFAADEATRAILKARVLG